MIAVDVSNWIAGVIAACAVITVILCLWAVPHHRRHRRDNQWSHHE